MDWQLLALSIIRTASAASAGVIAVIAYRAHARTGRRTLLGLATAAALLLLGFIGAGILYQIDGDLGAATLLEAPFTLAALLLMLASLYARREAGRIPARARGPPEAEARQG